MLIGDDAILRGVNVNRQNRNWLTPKDILDVVIETEGGSVSELYRVIQIFQTVSAKNARSERPRLKHNQPTRNPFRMIKNHINAEINNSTNEQRETLMIVATLIATLTFTGASGTIEVVRALLRVGPNHVLCRLKDKDDSIPLHCAVQRGRIEVVKELVSSFPESLKEVNASFETPLHVAVKNNQVEATKLLLEEIKKRDMSPEILNMENREGNTILHLATLGKQLQASFFFFFTHHLHTSVGWF
ncbi:hypothetical protein F2Q69_00010672 [Brassica cretica]|uniref:PGG domain-containing protein n=1 Tax=Brassica cretica TaxID=69181 RepID=A0A8S9R3G1_BRACR|nr:hypothetical protein F2Q69_00010672 [Brassica cretica]